MIRRIGFGKSKEKRSDLTSAPLTKPTKTDKKPMSRPLRLAIVIYLGIWLIGWSLGIIFAVVMLFTGNGFSKLFLVFFITLASGGWLHRPPLPKPKVGEDHALRPPLPGSTGSLSGGLQTFLTDPGKGTRSLLNSSGCTAPPHPRWCRRSPSPESPRGKSS